MNERELISRLEDAVPTVPTVFHNAMLSAFAQIQEQEARENNVIEMPSRPRGKMKRRTAAIILIAALLMAGAAVATAVMPKVLSTFWGKDVTVREDFPDRVKSDVTEVMVGDCRVRIEEAVYDGVSLYVTYSVRNMSVERMMGAHFRGTSDGDRLLTEEDLEEMSTWEVGNWHDGLWINGRDTDMPETAVIEVGGDEPGEVLVSSMYHLGLSGIVLEGDTRIALPIGKRQHWDFETYQTLPRDEDGGLKEPEEGCVVFYLNADGLDVERIKDGPVSLWPGGTQVWTAEATFTPVKLYLTLNYHVPDEQVEAYKQAMGSDGFYLDGRLVYPYSALDVANDWIGSFALVDAEGHLVGDKSSNYDGCYSMGDAMCQYIFPYVDEYPSPLYVAPLVNDTPDMARKVLVRE